jgi:hypothetical protein
MVVLGQWVRAGLDLARGAGAGRGLVGGAVALWRVLQAVRLAMQLAQRLSDLRDVLSTAAPETSPETSPGETPDQGSATHPLDPPGAAAFLHHALSEIARTIRDALGLVPARRRRPDADKTQGVAAEPEIPRAQLRLTSPRGRPPDRPPRPERRRRPLRGRILETTLTPIAAPASGRFRLAEA